MSEIKMLPLPETLRRSGFKSSAEAYTRANVAHATAPLQAEIERLRAEARQEQDYAASAARRVLMAQLAQRRAEARAERLAEALDTIARVGKASRNQTTRTRWIVARAISALNGDNDWQALPKPKGFHDALLRDQEVGND